jgi:VCBS repeat-containing protein
VSTNFLRKTGQLFRGLAIAALVVAGLATTASAETLLMPNRDARRNTPVIVWGVTTLANGSAFTLDYGDGSPVQAGNVGDRSFLAFSHNYATAGNYTATLTVGGIETATVKLQVFDPALLTADANRSLGINMAIEDGLRYLWTQQTNRGNFDTTSVTAWSGSYPVSYTSLVTLAFQNHGYGLPTDGSAPTGLYPKYLVRRGLNYVISNLSQRALGAQPAGNPCIGSGADCVGLQHSQDGFHDAYTTSVAMLSIAGSGSMARVNTEVGGYVSGKTYGEILQRMANSLIWGQIDIGNSGRGGWFYGFNNGNSSDGSTVGWAYLALMDAEAAGITVPAWVKTEAAFGVTANLNNNGSFDYQSDNNPNSLNSVGMEKGGIGLQGLFFTGETSGPRVENVKKYLSDRWSGFNDGSWSCGGASQNKGCAYSMFNAFKGLKLQGVTTLPGVTRAAGPGAQPAGDWYADYQDWLVANQTAANTTGGGYWGSMGFSCCDNSSVAVRVAIGELILSPVALVLPDEQKFSTVGLTPATNSAIEGGTHTVTAHAESTGGSPVPGATVNFTILSGPNAGLTGTGTTDASGNATFTYTDGGPEGTTGQDLIQAKIGTLTSNTVEMNWLPNNQPPVAVDDAFSTSEDTALSATVIGNDSDPNGDTLIVSLVTGTSNGTLVLNADGTFTYTPNANFNGSDSFTYKVNDGTVDGNTATVTITVNPVNDPPVAANDAASTNEDTPVNGTVLPNDSDIDGDMLTVSLVSGPSHGTVILNPNGTFTYAPALNFNGVDTFTYVANDGSANSNVATVTITVTPVNDNPVCSVTGGITEIWPPNHKLVAVPLSGGSDVDGDALTIKVTSIRQDEPTNTQGDGNTSVDAAGIGTSVAQVRAERAGTPKAPGNGRMYHINYTVTDGAGGSCGGTVKVGVPHDQGKGSVVIDGGPLFNSLGF